MLSKTSNTHILLQIILEAMQNLKISESLLALVNIIWGAAFPHLDEPDFLIREELKQQRIVQQAASLLRKLQSLLQLLPAEAQQFPQVHSALPS